MGVESVPPPRSPLGGRGPAGMQTPRCVQRATGSNGLTATFVVTVQVSGAGAALRRGRWQSQGTVQDLVESEVTGPGGSALEDLAAASAAPATTERLPGPPPAAAGHCYPARPPLARGEGFTSAALRGLFWSSVQKQLPRDLSRGACGPM